MVTNEDAIKTHIQYCEKQKHPSHSVIFHRGVDITIKTLQSAPRDLAELQKVIARKTRQHEAAITWEQKDIIGAEIHALEWVRMIIRGSDRARQLEQACINCLKDNFLTLLTRSRVHTPESRESCCETSTLPVSRAFLYHNFILECYNTFNVLCPPAEEFTR